ncbi:hypothetical protein ACP4OV_028066 [Aristida adscensionis]
MAAAASRKLALLFLPAWEPLGFGPGPGGEAAPWDVVAARLAELLRLLVSALLALAGQLQDAAAALAVLARAVVLPAAAAAAALVVVCCCCGHCTVMGRRRRKGPDGEEVEGVGRGDGPVVRYRGGAGAGAASGYNYRGGVFSMHPNKPIVC